MYAQRLARSDAEAVRKDHLKAVMRSELTPLDVIDQACRPIGRPLRTISLDKLFGLSKMTHHEWMVVRARMLDIIGGQAPANPTVGWVIDSRAGGRRHYALRDALRLPDHIHTWEGFPWAPRE